MVLDKTLADLYAIDNDGNIPELAYSIPSPSVQVAASMPVPKRYPYQAPRVISLGNDVLARTYLCTGAQSYNFVAGKMRLTLFDPDVHKNEPKVDENGNRAHVTDAWKTFDQLPESQQPQIQFVSNGSEIEVEEDARVAIMLPNDNLQHLPSLVDLDTHYRLLSKRELALATLPTPQTDVIECNISVKELDDDQLVDAEVDRFLEAVEARAPEFVVKLPQALAGQGVFVIKTEKDKTDAIKALKPEVKRMIQQMDESNKHLHPACLMLQKMLPGTAVALSIFVTKSGRAIFTGCCEQAIDAKGQWSGAMIDYSRQKALEEEYADVGTQMARFVNDLGYWGPMGADIMTDEGGKQYVIDLNVRVAGSYPLGLLKGHFHIERGYNNAALLYPLGMKGTRADFDYYFDNELMEGRVVVCGWCHGRIGPWGIIKYSVVSLVVAAETPEVLTELIAKVNKRVHSV